jgi:hypothetical protein
MPSEQPRRIRRASFVALVAAGVLAVAACGGNASPSPTAEPSPSPTEAATPEPSDAPTATPDESASTGELHISLPEGWQEIEMTQEALEAQIEALSASNPELVAPLQQLLDSGSFESIAFYAMGYDGLLPIGNVNAITFPMAGMSLDAVAPVIEGQFAQIGAEDIELSDRTVLGTDGLQIDYRLPATMGTATTTLTGRVYLALIDDVVYDVTLTCTEPDPTACLADGDEMADGMTLGEP